MSEKAVGKREQRLAALRQRASRDPQTEKETPGRGVEVPEEDELSEVVTTAVSMRVSHPLGWKFEVVGPQEIVDDLWERWLRFLHPKLIVAEEDPGETVRGLPLTPDLSRLPEIATIRSAAPSPPKTELKGSDRPRRGGPGPRYDWAQARQWYESGKTYKEIAELLGCHWISVSEHCRKEKWIKPQDKPETDVLQVPFPPSSAPLPRPSSVVNTQLTRLCWNCATVVPDRATCVSCHASKTSGRFSEDS